MKRDNLVFAFYILGLTVGILIILMLKKYGL